MMIRRFFVGAFVLMAFSVPPMRADDVVVTLDVAFSSAAPGAPGDWQLFGRVDDTGSGPDGSFGISAIRALLTEIDFGIEGDAINIAPGIGAFFLPSGLPVTQILANNTIELLYGQDIANSSSVVSHVGNNGDELIAFGTFSAGQSPGFGRDGRLFTEAPFLNTDSPPFSSSIGPGATMTVVIQRIVPEPTSLALLLVGGLALSIRRRSRG